MAPRGAPPILFAPGAGAPSTSAWMRRWAARLATLGPVTTLDYPYAEAGRRRPDPLPTLIAAHRAALERLGGPPDDVVLAGKSMGSRVACHVALEVPVRAIVCLGYPLVGAGKTRPVRDQVLLALARPVLFVSGTRDPLCPLDRLAEVRARMHAPSALHVVEGGGHSLEVGRRALAARGRTQDDEDDDALAAIARFLTDR